jgi:hypothetical protein
VEFDRAKEFSEDAKSLPSKATAKKFQDAVDWLVKTGEVARIRMKEFRISKVSKRPNTRGITVLLDDKLGKGKYEVTYKTSGEGDEEYLEVQVKTKAAKK